MCDGRLHSEKTRTPGQVVSIIQLCPKVLGESFRDRRKFVGERFTATHVKVTIYWTAIELVNKYHRETEELTVVQPASYLWSIPVCAGTHTHTHVKQQTGQ